MRSLFRRYRTLVFLAALFVAPLLVYAVYGRRPTRLNLLDRAVIRLTAPAEKLIVRVASGIVDGVQSYLWLRKVRDENLELRRRVVSEQSELWRAQEIKAENDRLRRLAGLRERIDQIPSLSAEVVAVGASPLSHTLRIARGRRDGVTENAPVVSPDGVVGRVAQIADGYSDVQLLTSLSSAIAAVNQRTRGRSTVKGANDVERCKVEYALRTDDMQDGDLLVTAGGAGFPKGLRIGKVADVQKQPYGLFQTARLVPAVDFSRLDEVLVLLPPPEPPAIQPPAPSQLPVAQQPLPLAPKAIPAVAQEKAQ